MLQTAVVVIGGGATGLGVLRDLALRGVPAILLESGDLAHGTTSRFHGLLHSGARYAVRDPESAHDCIVENGILRRVARHCVEDTEGLFVRLREDDPAYEARWVEACRAAGIPVEAVPLDEVRRLEPHLTPSAVAVYRVPDAAIDGFRLVWQNAAAAERLGAQVHTYARVTAVEVRGGRVEGVRYRGTLDGREERIACACVVNATGPWVGEVARLAGVQVAVRPDRGTLVAFNHRFTSRVVNRLRTPGDGDIFVPHGSVTILGTTSAPAERPDDHAARPDEVRRLLQLGRQLFEDLSEHRILRAFSGNRPLYDGGGAGGRAASRSFVLLDHAKEGLSGFFTITGGKLTTYRHMAEVTADHVCAQLGTGSACRTAIEPLVEEAPRRARRRARRLLPPHVADSTLSRLGSEVEAVLRRLQDAPQARQLVCECELVTRAEVEEAGARATTHSLDDVRRRTRMGMGTCQGTFCALRGVAALAGRAPAASPPVAALRQFLQARWRGIRPALWGKQLRETELMRAIYQATLNVDGGRP